MRAFDHRFMPVYRLSVEVVVDVHRIARSLPLAARVLSDQTNRAASSIVLNIAEGAGEFTAREKARFYRIARRSAAETSAALDLLEASGFVQEEHMKMTQERLLEIGAMLTGMVKAQARRSAKGPPSESRPRAQPQPQP